MKYVSYLRVSTARQGNSGLGLEAQRSAVYSFVKNGAIIREFLEVESGKVNNRPKLNEAIEFAKQNNATLLIAKLDRLSRNAAFIFQLRDSGVEFVCADMPNANTLTIGIFATIAQNERELISERTIRALKAKKARGEQLGNIRNLSDIGRKKGAETNKLKACSDLNNMRAHSYAIALRQGDRSLNEVTELLNQNGYRTPTGKLWNRGSVHRLLSRREFSALTTV